MVKQKAIQSENDAALRTSEGWSEQNRKAAAKNLKAADDGVRSKRSELAAVVQRMEQVF